MTAKPHRGAVTAKNWLAILAIIVVASAIGIACVLALNWFPEQGSNVAPKIDTFWDVLIIVSVPIFVAVTTMILFSIWRWRQRPGEEGLDGPPIHGSTKLEVIWTIIPTIIIAALTTYAAILLVDIQAAPAQGTRVVNVTGVQFAWDFETQTPAGTVKTAKLYLPVNEPVKFNVHSKDVIHDFWVPAFRLKVDAVPGITTSYNLTPTKLGTFDVVCAELCGLGHAYMRQTVTVLTPERYAAMMAGLAHASGATAPAAGGSADAEGKKMFVAGNPATGATACGACHAMKAAGTTAATGPNLDEMLKEDNAAGIMEMIVNPNKEIVKGYSKGIMPPNYATTMTKSQLDALVKYIDQSVHGKG